MIAAIATPAKPKEENPNKHTPIKIVYTIILAFSLKYFIH